MPATIRRAVRPIGAPGGRSVPKYS